MGMRELTSKEQGVSVVAVVLVAILIIVFGLWAFKPDSDSTQQNTDSQSAEPTTTQPAEPVNPNTTGGSDGVGTGTSNDQSIPTPSPAGGVDTDNNRTD